MMGINAISEKVTFNHTPLSEDASQKLVVRTALVKQWVSDAESYIKKNKLDPNIFSPLWGEATMCLIAGAIFAGNLEVIEGLRLLWWFSGWPIVNYMQEDTFPLLDPTYIRYQKLKTITPTRFQYVAPSILGEAGWIEGDGVVNHDVAILQERIQFLYFSGITDFLDKTPQGTILELGSGYGGMSLAFHQCFPEYRNVLCDVPQCLAVAYCYLNTVLPDADHYAITTEGIYHANTQKLVSAEEAFNKIGAFIYLPNYLMPAYKSYLQPTMAFNAMSLHEMPADTIKYYCATLSKLLAPKNGIFCELNTLVGLPNVAIDQRLTESFTYCKELDYPSLACRPRIWTDSLQTFNEISAHYAETFAAYPLQAFFEFDCIKEFPVISDEHTKALLMEKLGKRILPLGQYHEDHSQVDGCPLTLFVVPQKDEPFMGNHLRYIVGRRLFAKLADQNTINELTTQLNLRQHKINELTAQVLDLQQHWAASLLKKIKNKYRVLKLRLQGTS